MSIKRPRWAITIACLSKLNEKGLASRTDLYDVLGNEQILNRWVGRLEGMGFVDEIEKERKLYKKSYKGERMEIILKENQDLIEPFSKIFGGFKPYFKQQKQGAAKRSQ